MKIYLVAPLSHGNDSLVGIRVAQELKIEKWNIEKATTIISQCSPYDKEMVRIILYDCFCLDKDEKNAYVVAGSFQVEVKNDNLLYPLHPDRIITEGFGGYIGKIKNTISIMRLFKEGSIDVARVYLYDMNKGVVNPIFSSEGMPTSPQMHYYLSKKERSDLSAFLMHYSVPLSPSYIQLAFENFDQSYCNDNTDLAFLSLMIAVEVLFNDGVSELKYRIARGMAVLLGRSKSDCREIYTHIKKLYDKRSHLVHTGKSSILFEDMISLRYYLRLSIKELIRLKLSKTALSTKLLEDGFGQNIE